MRKALSKKQWKRMKRIHAVSIVSGIIIILVTVICILFKFCGTWVEEQLGRVTSSTFVRNIELKGNYPEELDLDVRLLTPNEYSRPQTELKKIKGVVIHYTANPKSDAVANRNYFENLKDTHTTKASSHFIIGLDGKIVQNIPTTEIAYASNDRNEDTISIECCHPDASGEFTKDTYDSLVELTAWICCEYGLKPADIIRHYDVTKKKCPKYFVDNEDEWEQFKKDVWNFIKANKK